MIEIDIIEHQTVLFWFKEFAKTEPLGFCFLTQGNINFFKRIWPNFEKNEKFFIWEKEFSQIKFKIYSNHQETIYRIIFDGPKNEFINDRKMGAYTTMFLKKLVEEIQEEI